MTIQHVWQFNTYDNLTRMKFNTYDNLTRMTI